MGSGTRPQTCGVKGPTVLKDHELLYVTLSRRRLKSLKDGDCGVYRRGPGSQELSPPREESPLFRVRTSPTRTTNDPPRPLRSTGRYVSSQVSCREQGPVNTAVFVLDINRLGSWTQKCLFVPLKHVPKLYTT